MIFLETFPKLECFICFQDSSIEPFIESKVCKCDGSLKLHHSCYLQLREYDDTCKICKTKYPKLPPKFINGFASIKIFADDYNPFDIFYTIDINHKKQGIETWYEDKVIKYEASYVNGIKHGMEKHYEYGTICSLIPYENGKIHGVVLGYKVDRSQIENGNFASTLYTTVTYEHGQIVKDSRKFYDVNINKNKERSSINLRVLNNMF